MYRVDQMIFLIILGLIALWILSGIYVIEANQVGLVRRFGALQHGLVQPGIHYRLPWPIDKIDRVNTLEVKGMDVGFYPEDTYAYTIMLPYSISGDINIIHDRYTIQYRISDPAKYKFCQIDPQMLLKTLAEAAIVESIASKNVDFILTTGKREVAEEIRQKLQKSADDLSLGVTIASIDTKLVSPPQNVQSAFQDVNNAQSDKSTKIHEANNRKNSEIPATKAQANQKIETANAYKYQRISRAEGEADRFLKLYAQYKSAPKVTSDRLFLQLIEQILPNVKVIVLATDKNGKPVKLKLLSGIMPTQPVIPGVSSSSE
jgi:membrane protease subunit HflK